MRQNVKRKLYVVLVIAAVVNVAMVGMTGATVTGVDEETTDTTFTTEVSDGDTLEDIDGNSSITYTITWTSDADSNVYAEWKDADSNRVVADNNSATTANTVSGTSYINTTISEDELIDVEHSINENVTLEVSGYENDSVDTPGSNITVHANFSDERSVDVVNTSETDTDDGASVDDSGTQGVVTTDDRFLRDDVNRSTVQTESRDVNGSSTDVVVVMTDSNLTDSLDEATADAASGDRLSNGGILSAPAYIVTAEIDGETVAVPTFHQSAPSEWGEDSTYAVLDTSFSGENAVVLNLGSDYEDADTVDSLTIRQNPTLFESIDTNGPVTGLDTPDDAPDESGAFGLGVLSAGATTDGNAATVVVTASVLLVRPEDLDHGAAPAIRKFGSDADNEDDEEADEQDGPTASATDDGAAASVEA